MSHAKLKALLPVGAVALLCVVQATAAAAATITVQNGGFGGGAIRMPGTDPGGVPRWAVPFHADITLRGALRDDSGQPQGGLTLVLFTKPFGQPLNQVGGPDTAADGTFTQVETILRGVSVSFGQPAAPGANIANDTYSNVIDFYAVPHVQLIKGGVSGHRIFYGNIGTDHAELAVLRLQRKSGRSWKTVKTARANGQGQYSIHVSGAPRGTYRLYFHSTDQRISLDNVSNTVKV